MNDNVYVAISEDKKDKIVFTANSLEHARHEVINCLDLSRNWFVGVYYAAYTFSTYTKLYKTRSLHTKSYKKEGSAT